MTSRLAELLESPKEHIVASFVAQIERRDLSPPCVSRSALVDHIPSFLDEIASGLHRAEGVRFSDDALDRSATARQHGEQRWSLGYDLEALVREYGILRHAILETARRAELQLAIEEFDVLAKCLSVGVVEAATEYIKYRDREAALQRGNLEFLAEAGQLLTSSLDYRAPLGRLTGLIVPRMADWCAVHLDGNSVEEMAIAHVDPSKAAIVREIYARFPVPEGVQQGHREVIRTGEPQYVGQVDSAAVEAQAESPENLALLRQVRACSWLIVPLRIQGHMFGALTLAFSESGCRYDEDALVLAVELACRAAVAIDNARLDEPSQKEHSRVEAATHAKDEFVAMVSHELRTPLNSILGWLRLLRGGVLPEQKREHALEVIERNANAQNQIVADLLDISRVITGKIRINPSQVDFANVVEMAVEGVRPAADAKRITIQVDLAPPSLLRGDGDRLQQVVWNLLANAVKFTPKGGNVTVRLRRVDSDLELTIADDGEGIPESFLPHVFDSFRQSDSSVSRRHGGLGLGLSIAKHLVELHGGAIEARSSGPGSGATFLVRLPISPLVSTTLGVSRVPAATSVPVASPIIRAASGLRVLVVDDEPDARALLGYRLESCGMEVRVAGSAKEAVAILDDYAPDVVISDIGMPNEDGYSLIRTIRTLPVDEKKSVPAIALTAFARNEDRTRALLEGFNLHMAKPVEPTALVSAVLELAGHGRR